MVGGWRSKIMKRMVFVQKTSTIPSLSGHVIPLRASSTNIQDLIIPGDGKVHMYNFDLDLKVNGDLDFYMNFRLIPEMIDKGVMLVGAYHDGAVARLAVISFNQDIRLKEKQSVAEVLLTETVRYFQADLSNAVKVIDTETLGPKKPRKRK